MLRALALLAALASPTVQAKIPTGMDPCGAAAARGAMWVANDGSGTLARIDPRTNRVTRRIAVGRGVCSVDARGGFVWVTNYRDGSVVRVNTRTGAVRRAHVGAEPFDVLVTPNRVWVTAWADGTLVELDPVKLRVRRRISIGPHPAGLVSAAGAIWVGFGRDAKTVAKVAPRSGRITRVPVHVRAPAWFSAHTRDLWITADDNALVRLDPRTRRVESVRRFGATLGHPGASGDGRLWVPDKEIDRVFLVDTRSGRPLGSFAGGDGAFEATRAFGSMWVTSYAGSDIWRFGL